MKVVERCKEVYRKLQDEVSRDVFLNRMLYQMTGEKKYADSLLAYIPERKLLYEEIHKHEGQKLVLFGAGAAGQETVESFPDIHFEAVVDNFCELKAIHGVPVISPSQLSERYPDAFVIVTVRHFYKDIAMQLVRLGFSDENIYLWGKALDKMTQRQYFDLDQLPHTAEEVFIDAGAYDGETAKNFAKWSGGGIGIFMPLSQMRNLQKSAKIISVI